MKHFSIYTICTALVAFSLFSGQYDINILDVTNTQTLSFQIFWDIRIPRLITVFFTGAILGLSGLVLQILFRNPLVEPYTLGISGGATLGVAIGLLFSALSIQFSAFLGAEFTAIVLALTATRFTKFNPEKLLLLGIGLSSLYGALIFFIYNLSTLAQTYSIMRFTLGSFGTQDYTDTLLTTISAFAVLWLGVYFKPEFAILGHSLESAFLKGIDTKKISIIAVSAISLSVAVTVSIVGPIGFVGLLVPRLLKLITNKPLSTLIIPSFIFGGFFLLACDDIAKSLPNEFPTGIITSIIGAPFFIYLLLKGSVTK